MTSDTRKWRIFGSVLAAGFVVVAVIDLAFRHPLVAAWLLMIAVLAAGSSAPFNYAEDSLEGMGHPVAQLMRGTVIPVAIVLTIGLALFQLLAHGPARALAVLVLLYVADRVVGWTIDQQRQHRGGRTARRSEFEDVIVVEGATVGEPAGADENTRP